MNPTVKGIFIGLLGSLLLIIFVKIAFFSESPTVPQNLPVTNKLANQTKAQVTNAIVNQSNNNEIRQSNVASNSNESLVRKQKEQELIALYYKYTQMEEELSQQLEDLDEESENVLTTYKERSSQAGTVESLRSLTQESENELKRIKNQKLKTQEKLTLIRVKKQMLPLTALTNLNSVNKK